MRQVGEAPAIEHRNEGCGRQLGRRRDRGVGRCGPIHIDRPDLDVIEVDPGPCIILQVDRRSTAGSGHVGIRNVKYLRTLEPACDDAGKVEALDAGCCGSGKHGRPLQRPYFVVRRSIVRDVVAIAPNGELLIIADLGHRVEVP